MVASSSGTVADSALQADKACFWPHFALLALLPDEDDEGGTIALHEMSHALTFGSSDFYAEFARRVFIDEKIPVIEPELNHFLESIPSVFLNIGGRQYPGTNPTRSAVEDINACVDLYYDYFNKIWQNLGARIDIPSPSGKIGKVNPTQLFKRAIAIIIAQTALELAFLRGRNSDPLREVAELRKKMEASKDLILPTAVVSPDEFSPLTAHIERLMGKDKRMMVGMFDDHIRLIEVLTKGREERLNQFILLLPALIGLEFFIQDWPPTIYMQFLRSETADYAEAMDRYINRKLRTPSLKRNVKQHLQDLHLSLLLIRPPILIADEHLRDPQAHRMRKLIGLREFFRTLPNFLKYLLSEVPFGVEEAALRLDILEKSIDGLVSASLQYASTQTKRSVLTEASPDKYELRGGVDPKVGRVYYLAPR
jgi:hypothetical protein